MQFAGSVLTEAQQLVFKFAAKSDNPDKPGKEFQLKIVVKSLEGTIMGQPKALQVSNLILNC